MLPSNSITRLSASPWWPLLLWLGLPVLLANLSVACWMVFQLYLIMAQGPYSPAQNTFWMELLQFATIASYELIAVQLLVASLILACGPGRFWLRLATYWGAIGWLAGSCAASFWLSRWLMRYLDHWQMQSGILVHDSYVDIAPGGIISAAATLPMVLLAVQSPYWLLRVIGNGRLQRLGAGEPITLEMPTTESLSIRNLLEATTIVAVSLGLLQLADRFAAQAQPGTHLLSMLAISGGASVGAFIVGLPFTALFLRNVQLPVAWAITVGTALGCAAAFSVALLMLGGAFSRMFINLFSGFLMLFGSYALALTVLRKYGWRLADRRFGVAESKEAN